MLNYILDELKKIMAIDSPSGFTRKAADYIMQQLREFGFEPELTRKGCVLCCLGGEGSPVVFSAHIDTLGGMVSEVKSNGRLKLTRIGGMNANNAECENARVYTRDDKVFEGCFQMNNPSVHVNGEYDSQKRSYDNMELVLDEKVFSADETKNSALQRAIMSALIRAQESPKQAILKAVSSTTSSVRRFSWALQRQLKQKSFL